MSLKKKASGLSQEKAHSGAGGSTSTTTIDMSLVLAGVAGILRTKAIIPAEGDYTKEERFSAYFDQYSVETGKLLADEPDAIAAINAYKTWLETSDYVWSEPIRFVVTEFSVSLTMNAPSGSISVTMKAEPIGGNADSEIIRKMKDRLQTAVNEAFGKQNAAHNQATNQSETQKKRETEEVEVETLRVQEYQGKTVYRLIPTEGRWTKYGLPLYKNDAKKLKLDLPTGLGEYEFEGTCEYEIDADEKPTRVINFLSA